MFRRAPKHKRLTRVALCGSHGLMREGPDITRLAAMIGDPARNAMLSALMTGRAFTAGELACEAGVSAPTASGHLAQLMDAALIAQRKQGRHRYYTLSSAEVADALEALAVLAAGSGHLRTRPGPKEAALREARVCYDHLAGARAVRVFDVLAARGFLAHTMDALTLSEAGGTFVARLGVDVDSLHALRRPLCRACLDWSERRSHLSGALGAALLERFLEAGWVRRSRDSRHVSFTPPGEAMFREMFAPQAA